jgi:hypothetical protein
MKNAIRKKQRNQVQELMSSNLKILFRRRKETSKNRDVTENSPINYIFNYYYYPERTVLPSAPPYYL